ncbi:universal stress protein [Baekduia soli]|uniref:universal stress protein n=1 Tax=Baekduia soli TaxID=496014 RepID=UPI001651D219|nr:universal stress protein [Baekduia soli]
MLPIRHHEVRMFTKVIIGVDGHEGGRDAIALARALAPGAELVLACAYPYDERRSRFALQGFAIALREEALHMLRAEREAAGDETLRAVTVADPAPARGLQQVAADEHADLLVVGSSHRGPAGRVLLGDVSRSVLHGAPCAVAVAPRGVAAGTPATIGVAFDGSSESVHALELAAALAQELGATLQVAEGIELGFVPARTGFDIVGLMEDLREASQTTLDHRLEALPVPATGVAVVGRTRATLGELAARVDLMVCGSRGWGPVRQVVLGSTADHLIHHAHCPVLVVPRGAEAPAGAPASAESAGAHG